MWDRGIEIAAEDERSQQINLVTKFLTGLFTATVRLYYS